MTRLRLGIVLIVVSWLPFAQVLIALGEEWGLVETDGQANRLRLVVWSVQVLIGLVGVWLAGKVAVATARRDGWRQTPRHMVRLFRHGGDAPPA